LTDNPYYPVNRNIELLPHIVNFISADNSNTYLKTLSLIELVHLYQEADFWAVDTHILDTIRNSIIDQLRNADTLTWLLSSKENLSHFISASNPVTLDTLTRALHPYTSNMLWHTVTQPVKTLTDHTEWISSLAVHADGTLFSCGSDQTVRVWKTDAQGTYRCVQALTGHTRCIYTVAVHTDGTLFSGSEDSTIRVWKTDAQGIYYCAQTLEGHTNSISSVTVHTDGTLLSGSGKTIRVWKIDPQGKYKCAHTLEVHTGSVWSVAVHTDGTLLSGFVDGTIRVWKKNAQGQYYYAQTLTGHTQWILSVAVHADGTLFSGSGDSTIRVWKTDAQGIYYCAQTLEGHTNSINSVTVHTDGTLLSGSYDKTIRVWKPDVQSIYHCVQTLIGHTGSIRTLAVHIDGTLFSGSGDSTIRVWKTLEEHISLEQHLLLHWVFNTYQLNNNTQINTLPAHQFQIYRTLPQSIKNHIVTWYKPGYIQYLFSKPYVWASGGLIAGCTALGAYVYYKWFKK
jgi:WD40 repeat protein